MRFIPSSIPYCAEKLIVQHGILLNSKFQPLRMLPDNVVLDFEDRANRS